jgi:hypothetical protein
MLQSLLMFGLIGPLMFWLPALILILVAKTKSLTVSPREKTITLEGMQLPSNSVADVPIDLFFCLFALYAARIATTNARRYSRACVLSLCGAALLRQVWQWLQLVIFFF